METTLVQKRFILIGGISGILATIIYPFIYYLNLGVKVDLLLDLIFGFAMAFTVYGAFRFVRINRDSVSLQIGLLTGILAAFTFLLMSGIIAAMTAPLENVLVKGDQSFVYSLTSRLYTGVDFIWNLLIGISILTFSLAFFKQPRPGKVVAFAGIIVSLVILIFAFIFFPESPEVMNYIGMGPTLPLWHLIVSVLMLLSLKWIKVKEKIL
jgi:hypothetical protein